MKNIKEGYISIWRDIKLGWPSNDNSSVKVMIGAMAICFLVAIHIGWIGYTISYYQGSHTSGWTYLIASGIPYIIYRFFKGIIEHENTKTSKA